MGVLRQDHYAFDKLRVIDTVIMGNERLWKALEERDVLYARTDMSNGDGMRLGELEGIVGEEDGYTAESDAAILLQGLDIPDALHGKLRAQGVDARVVTQESKDTPTKMSMSTAAGVLGIPCVPLKAFLAAESIPVA